MNLATDNWVLFLAVIACLCAIAAFGYRLGYKGGCDQAVEDCWHYHNAVARLEDEE